MAANSNTNEIPLGPMPCKFSEEKPSLGSFEKIISIVVGPPGSEKTFLVFRGLLCSRSRYFNNLLNGGFKEAGSEFVRLEDVDMHAFQIFYLWLNTGQLDCTEGAASPHPEAVCQNIVDTYIFADYHRISKLKNALIDYYYFHVDRTRKVTLGRAQKLYDHTQDGDLLRRLVIDIYSRACNLRTFKERGIEYPKQFLFEFICALEEHQIAPGAKGFTRKGFHADMQSHFCERYPDHSDEIEANQNAEATPHPS